MIVFARRSSSARVILFAWLLAGAFSAAAVASSHVPVVWVPDAGRLEAETATVGAEMALAGITPGGVIERGDLRRLGRGELFFVDALGAEYDDLERSVGRLEDALDVLAQRYPGWDPPILVGHGHGGLAVAELARRDPSRLSGAVAVAAPLSGGEPRRAVRLGQSLAEIAGLVDPFAGEGEVRRVAETVSDRRLVAGWLELVGRHREALARTLRLAPDSYLDLVSAPLELLRQAWGRQGEELKWLAALEEQFANAVNYGGEGAGGRGVLPVVTLGFEAASASPLVAVLVQAAAALNEDHTTGRGSWTGGEAPAGNGLLLLSSQLAAGPIVRVAEAGYPSSQGFAFPTAGEASLALPSGLRRVTLPALRGELEDLSGVREALAALGWRKWSAHLGEEAYALTICDDGRSSDELTEMVNGLAVVLHPASTVLWRSCQNDSCSDDFVGTLQELEAGGRPAEAAEAAAMGSPVRDRLVVTSRAAVAATEGREGWGGYGGLDAATRHRQLAVPAEAEAMQEQEPKPAGEVLISPEKQAISQAREEELSRRLREDWFAKRQQILPFSIVHASNEPVSPGCFNTSANVAARLESEKRHYILAEDDKGAQRFAVLLAREVGHLRSEDKLYGTFLAVKGRQTAENLFKQASSDWQPIIENKTLKFFLLRFDQYADFGRPKEGGDVTGAQYDFLMRLPAESRSFEWPPGAGCVRPAGSASGAPGMG